MDSQRLYRVGMGGFLDTHLLMLMPRLLDLNNFRFPLH
jgi:hypothetical protein